MGVYSLKFLNELTFKPKGGKETDLSPENDKDNGPTDYTAGTGDEDNATTPDGNADPSTTPEDDASNAPNDTQPDTPDANATDTNTGTEDSTETPDSTPDATETPEDNNTADPNDKSDTNPDGNTDYNLADDADTNNGDSTGDNTNPTHDPNDKSDTDADGNNNYELSDNADTGDDAGTGDGSETPDNTQSDGNTDYNLDDGSGDNPTDTTGDSTDGTDDGTDTTPTDSGEGNELKDLETNLFKDLSPEQVDIKIKELKDNYLKLYNSIDPIIERLDKVEKSAATLRVIEFCKNKLTELKDLVYQYLKDSFNTKTYTENSINYQTYLTTLATINQILGKLS